MYTYSMLIFLFQDVAEPSNFCSVCGLPRMAKRQEPEISSLTHGSETCQPQNFSKTDGTVEREGLSALSSVENLGSSTDIQNKGSADFCSAESQVLSSGMFSADDDLEATLKITEVRSVADIECQQLDCEHQAQSVENTGLSNSTDVQSKGSFDSCFSRSPLISDVVLSASDDPVPASENADTECGHQTECSENTGLPDSADIQSKASFPESPSTTNAVLSTNDDLKSTLKSTAVENTGLSNFTELQNKGPSVESLLMSNSACTAGDNSDLMLGNTENKAPTGFNKCSRYDHEIADGIGQVTTDSEPPERELFSAAPKDVVHDTQSSESGLPHAGDVNVCSPDMLSLQSAVMDTAAACDDTAAEGNSVSSGNLGELLSCAECGSSGLYFFGF